MTNQAEPVLSTLKFSDFIMRLTMQDATNELARTRSRGSEGPSIAWIVGHLAHYRCEILELLGSPKDTRYAAPFGENGASDGSDYPDIEELKAAWEELATKVESALGSASDETLSSRPAGNSPHAEKTVLETLSFLAWHEPYHIGQLGALRAQLGLTPTSTLAVEASRRQGDS